MLALVIILSLFAALSNATSAVLQRRAGGKVEADELFRGKFMLEVTKNRIWLAGLGLQVIAFLLQAAALKSGSLIVVEPLLTTDLVFLVLILQYKFKIHTGLREWGGVVGICAGLSGLLATAHPQSGHLTFNPISWALITGIIGAFIGAVVFFVRRSPSRVFRASVSGIAAGASFALTAAFTKLAVAQFERGLITFFTTWEVYALLASGIISLMVMQSTYGAGPLAASQPALEITDPAVSTLIGIVLFGDTVNHSTSALAIEAACAAVLVVGVIALSGSGRIHSASDQGM